MFEGFGKVLGGGWSWEMREGRVYNMGMLDYEKL
jgi:hypothetical protein